MEIDKKELLIRMKIPFIGDPDMNSEEYMIFHRWLPLNDEEFIHLNNENINLKFWFDIESTWWVSQPDESEIRKWENITAHYIYADLTIKNLDEEIIHYLTDPKSSIDNDDKAEFAKQCSELGKQWMFFALNHFNRLIAYARSHKGQYWLHEYPLDTDYFLRFEAQAKIGDSDWFRFDPINNRIISIIMPTDYERYFDKESWNQAKEFVCSESRPDLHLYLLAGAETLLSKGNSRAALTEAVAALEVMVHSFSRKPKNVKIINENIRERLGLETFENTVSHLGFSTTINCLFPIIFNEKQLPLKIIKDCQEAILVRGNVVHQGQREIDPKNLRRYIKSIRELCKLLESMK